MTLGHAFAKNLKKRRLELNMTQSHLAELLDTSPTYIAMIETETRTPSFAMAEAIANVLKVDPPDLFSKTECSEIVINELFDNVLSAIENAVKTELEKFRKNQLDL